MEDSHISDLNFNKDKNQQLFGVFDGHGGKEVAQFTQNHFNELLLRNTNYQTTNYVEGLRETFLDVDKELEKDSGKEELIAMKKKNPPNKSPLFKILGETLGQGQNGTEERSETISLDAIGCTANVILIDNYKSLVVANAGDSRCVLSREGRAVPLSFDHKPENEEERRRIEKAGSTITEGRVDGNLNLSRSLGDLKYK